VSREIIEFNQPFPVYSFIFANYSKQRLWEAKNFHYSEIDRAIGTFTELKEIDAALRKTLAL